MRAVARLPPETEDEPMDLRLEHVTKSFGAQGSAVEALRGVSLDVSSAALVALMGASGSGKSTLLQVKPGAVVYEVIVRW
jgi:putative ABC transport system ATP-binding protein